MATGMGMGTDTGTGTGTALRRLNDGAAYGLIRSDGFEEVSGFTSE